MATNGADVANKALDKVTDLITSVADKSSDIFQASSEIITKSIEKYGPQAIDAVLWVVRLDSIQVLITSLVSLIACFIAFKIFRKIGFKKDWYCGGDNHYDESGVFKFFSSWIATFVIIFVTFISIKNLTNVWNYVAIAKPEIYLVKQVVDVVKEKATESKK